MVIDGIPQGSLHRFDSCSCSLVDQFLYNFALSLKLVREDVFSAFRASTVPLKMSSALNNVSIQTRFQSIPLKCWNFNHGPVNSILTLTLTSFHKTMNFIYTENENKPSKIAEIAKLMKSNIEPQSQLQGTRKCRN